MNVFKQLIGAVLEVSKVPEHIEIKRLAICDKCHIRTEDKCRACGCYIELKAPMNYNRNPKNGFKIEKTHCPFGMWPFIDEEGKEHENDLEIVKFYQTQNS